MPLTLPATLDYPARVALLLNHWKPRRWRQLAGLWNVKPSCMRSLVCRYRIKGMADVQRLALTCAAMNVPLPLVIDGPTEALADFFNPAPPTPPA